MYLKKIPNAHEKCNNQTRCLNTTSPIERKQDRQLGCTSSAH